MWEPFLNPLWERFYFLIKKPLQLHDSFLVEKYQQPVPKILKQINNFQQYTKEVSW